MIAHRSKSKFRNVRVKTDGITFDSKAEWRRYVWLKAQEKAGLLSGLTVHKRFDLGVCKYVADFVYLDHGGAEVIEDVKGVFTQVFRIKQKLMAFAGKPIRVLTKETHPQLWRGR